jgi:hypothetical protein
MSTITCASLAEIPWDIAENAPGPIVSEVELEFLARVRRVDLLETSGTAASNL